MGRYLIVAHQTATSEKVYARLKQTQTSSAPVRGTCRPVWLAPCRRSQSNP